MVGGLKTIAQQGHGCSGPESSHESQINPMDSEKLGKTTQGSGFPDVVSSYLSDTTEISLRMN